MLMKINLKQNEEGGGSKKKRNMSAGGTKSRDGVGTWKMRGQDQGGGIGQGIEEVCAACAANLAASHS